MMPAETPWPTFLLCSMLTALLVSLAIGRQSTRLAIAAGLTGLIGIAAFGVDHFVVTPAERVANNVIDVVRAFEAGDADRMLGHFSPRRHCERTLATVAIDIVTVHQPLSIKDVQVEMSHADSIATSTFRVNGVVHLKGRELPHQPTMWRVTWRLEGGEYKIERLQELDPMRGEPINRLGSIGIKLCD
ncbi:MAG: hypothetical protein R3B90_11100 [Planctomycetaceae bacterium]